MNSWLHIQPSSNPPEYPGKQYRGLKQLSAMIQQQQLFNQEKVQTRGRLRDLQGRFATPEQRDFAIRWQKLNAVENENNRLKQTNVNQERLIEGMRMRILQLSNTIRQYESEFGALPIQNHQPSTNQ